MILNNSLDVLNSLAETLESNHVILDTVNNTYLAALMSQTTENVLHPMMGASAVTETGHDIIQDKVIDVVSKSVINQLNIIRSEIIPTIKSFYENLKNTIKSYNGTNPLLELSIVPRRIPDLLYDDKIASLLKSFKNLVPIEPISSDLTDLPSDELMKRVRAASREYYQQNYGDSSLLDKMTDGTDASLRYELSALNLKVNSVLPHNIIEESLTKYLLLEFLSNNEDLALEIYNVDSLDHLRNLFDSIRKYTLSLMARNKDVIESQSNNGNGLLIINYDKANKTINVNAEVYDNFLKNGGSPEVILGVFADNRSTPSDYFYQNLIDFKDKYLDSFNQYARIEEETRRLHYYDSFKMFFRLLFLQETSNYTDFEKEYCNLNPGAQEKIIEMLDEQLSTVTLDDIKDDYSLYQTVTRILTRTRYYYTDAHRLLTYIDEEHTDGKEMSSTVAIAVIYYLIDYFMDQVSVYPQR
jgi:hypothetical protein